ncbi:MAG: DUF1232 domain-containing protein [Deltaproteobacteria bacterium]|nr:DUF1232 domain-containing protein [Deltaproteobacteria bacterium]
MFEFIKSAKELKNKLNTYRLVVKDKRTPKAAKMLLWLAIGYTVMPFDIIPDFIPIIGHIDDAIIVPLLIVIAVKMVPNEVMEDAKRKANGG